MHQAGLGAEIITATVQGSGATSFDTSPDGLIELSSSGVPSTVIAAIVASPVGGDPALATAPVVFHTGERQVRGTALAQGSSSVGAESFLPVVGMFGSRVVLKFPGANSSTVVDRDVIISVRDTDYAPAVVRLTSKGGRRSLNTEGGVSVKGKEIVAGATIERDADGNWTVKLPAGLPDGEYAILLSRGTHMGDLYDFSLRS